jgi:hypothetical protein
LWRAEWVHSLRPCPAPTSVCLSSPPDEQESPGPADDNSNSPDGLGCCSSTPGGSPGGSPTTMPQKWRTMKNLGSKTCACMGWRWMQTTQGRGEVHRAVLRRQCTYGSTRAEGALGSLKKAPC